MTFHFSLPIYSLISTSNIKNKNIINSAANKGQSTVSYRWSLIFNSPYLLCNDHFGQSQFQGTLFYHFQKQPYTDVLQITCYQKFCNFHRKTSVLESLVNGFAGLRSFSLYFNLFPKETSTKVFSLNIAKFSRTAFFTEHSPFPTTRGYICQFDKLAVQ